MDDTRGVFPRKEREHCNNTPPDEVERRYVPCRCASAWCPMCREGAAVALRETLRPAMGKFKSVLLVTLTVDPKAYRGPMDAWDDVGRRRSISVLAQSLKRAGVLLGPEWFGVLEFHLSGWPHWHVVYNAEFIPFELLRDKWGRGHVFVTRTRSFENPDHALNYATKYVAKPQETVPDWVLDTNRLVRKFSTSRGLIPSDRKRSRGEGTGQRRTRTGREKMATCHTAVKVFDVRQGTWRFRGTLSPRCDSA